ncbi:MAG: PASTA domain-containing protein, partial [Pseudomonadota bacterium]
ADGSMLWDIAIPVDSNQSAATVLDLDRDGFNEVIYPYLRNSGLTRLRIFDGRDGSTKRDVEEYMGNGNLSIPFFADVDGDGASELIVMGRGTFAASSSSFYVFESELDDGSGNGWPRTRSIFNQWNYHVTQINDDGSVPQFQQPHWLLPGLNSNRINGPLPEERLEDSDQFTYRAFDGELESNVAQVDVQILPPNSPPRILSVPRPQASPGFEYRYAVLAVDTDPGELLAWRIAEGPLGMAVNGIGVISWTPGVSDLGLTPVVVEVTDSVGATAFQSFVIEVLDAVSVPDLMTLTESEAVSVLLAAGLVADPIVDVFSDTVPVGEVASQVPAAGVSAAAGSSVRVEVSRGPLPVDVPRLVGLDENEALARLAVNGLNAAPITRVNDPFVPAGIVVLQDPAPQSAVNPGSEISLTVSGGPRAVITVEPSLIPSGESALISVEIRDVDGTPLDPQPSINLALDIGAGDVFGTLPAISGALVTTSQDTQGQFDLTVSFDVNGPESVSTPLAALAPISDGPAGTVYTDFVEQQRAFSELIVDLQAALDANDPMAINAIDKALLDLETAIDLRRLRTMTLIAPEGGVPPSPEQALAGGLNASSEDGAYVDAGEALLELMLSISSVINEGTAPDVVLNTLNQELAGAAQGRLLVEPSVVGVLRASPSITALLGTVMPRLIVDDIRAVRQSLRDEGVLGTNGASQSARFTLIGLTSAVRIRSQIVSDLYLPYVGEVARAMGAVIAADLLQPLTNQGAIAGIITGASQSIHVFEIEPSVIEGFGFDPDLSPNNAVTMVGPNLLDAVQQAAEGIPEASDFKDLNSTFDTIQTQLDNATALEDAWNQANSLPMGVRRGCILDNRPDCRQLIFPDGFASVYESDSVLSLPAPVLIITRNLSSGSVGIFIAAFVPTEPED